MKYWITTHWAPQEDNEGSLPSGVYLRDGKEGAGKKLGRGDYVLIYQLGGGPVELRERPGGDDERILRRQGRKGIVVIAQARDRLRPNGDDKPTRYADGREIWWRWCADTELISRNGFVSAYELNKVLGYKPRNTMHGFGDDHSGLKEITEEQYDKLVRLFRRRSTKTFSGKALSHSRHKKVREGGSRPESDAHKSLKEFVASNPAETLKERGLRTLAVEFKFDSGDRGDVVLEDHAGRVIGVEIEVVVDWTDVAGILQAIKYRHMLAFVKRCTYEDTRSFLVAYAITKELQDICKLYSVECFVIPRENVRKWKSQGR